MNDSSTDYNLLAATKFTSIVNGKAKSGPMDIEKIFVENAFDLSQRLVEFGKDNAADVALREAQRNALFDYEDAVRTALFQIRLKFFTVLLRQQQLAERTRPPEGEARPPPIAVETISNRIDELCVATPIYI